MTEEKLEASVIRLPDHVVYREFAGETVVLNLETGLYHGLNPTAGRILSTLESSSDFSAAVATIAEQAGQPVERVHADTVALCKALLERKLIVVLDQPFGAAGT